MVGNCKHIRTYGWVMILFLTFISCGTSELAFNKKVISDTHYKEQFYITEKEPKAKSNVFYYWYKSQKVHSSQNDYSGAVLDGLYTKYYYSNQLAEKGNYNNGVKVGTWKSWYKNGQLATTEKWNQGKLTGKQVVFDSIGNILSQGAYTKGKRSGKWIYPQSGDTIYYKKGERKLKVKKDTSQPGFFQRMFKKKDNLKAKDTAKKKIASKKISKKKKTTQHSKKSNKKEPNFFQKLFAKKEKKKKK